MSWLAILGISILAQSQSGMTTALPPAGGIEGRPAAEAVSPLQAQVDRTAPGGTITVDGGRYVGDIYIDRPVRLVGRGRPELVGSGQGSVIRVRAAGTLIEGFDIDGRLGGSLDRDSSGVHVAAAGVVVRDVRIVGAYFGVYLNQADDAVVERTRVRGVANRPPGEQGSAIHVYASQRFRLIDNDLADMRDGIYLQSSSGGLVRANVARRLRYGLHYMYSDDNVFEDNRFEDGAAGAAIMYSKRVAFRRNRFLHNRGFASVGLLLKDCEDLVAEDNLIANNARGLFLEGSERNSFRRNFIAVSDVALVIFGSSRANVFEGNAFVANLSPLELVGRRTDTVFTGNYWSDADEPDLNGDGIRDRPYRLTSVFDHLRGNLTAAELFTRGPAARALGAAERMFPILAVPAAQDPRPLLRVPALSALPRLPKSNVQTSRRGLAVSGLSLVAGLAAFRVGRRQEGRPT